jgi:hypothetical protein
MLPMSEMTKLEMRLDSFDAAERRSALESLVRDHGDNLGATGANVNMHLHSFFSYNAEDWSPSRLAWECRKAGLLAAGLCDFDVLDGLDEFMGACRLVELRGSVNLETRAYLSEYADVDINSPGEPGVTYIMGGGFTAIPADGSPQCASQQGYKQRAGERNLALIGRINPHVGDIAVDYARDVLPLTPAGGATERHIIRAYTNRAATVYPELAARGACWAGLLGKSADEVADLLANLPALEEVVRAKLAKSGGLGYEQPSPSTFPLVDDFVAWVQSCGAIPMTTWLDGSNAGESDPDALLDLMTAKGCLAVNIVPDRNWNYDDAEKRATKVAALDAFVAAAARRHQPVNIGTEMNKKGLPFVDDLAGEVLGRHRAAFTEGAMVMVGHTTLATYADCPYGGARAAAEFADAATRNQFFAAVGQLPAINDDDAAELLGAGPDAAFALLREAVA